MWQYFLLIGMVLWILFDGFNTYRDYLYEKGTAHFEELGEKVEGEAEGPFFSRVKLALAVDTDGRVADACQVYSCRFVCFPRRSRRTELIGKDFSALGGSKAQGKSLTQNAVCSAAERYQSEKQLERLSSTEWILELLTEDRPDPESAIFESERIKALMAEGKSDAALLSTQERIFLRYLLLKMSGTQNAGQEVQKQNECERL